MRRRIEDLRSDIEAERGVLEARLQELVRRYGSTAAVRGFLTIPYKKFA